MLFLSVVACLLPYHSFFALGLVRSKSDTISNFKSLCDAYPGFASYESIGKSLLGNDIWIFRFGNPAGGRVLWDAEVHGSEDLGAEIAWIFVNWLLKSNDPRAQGFLQNNWFLVVPIIDIDTTNRCNMRRSYTLSTGDTLSVPNGVNLNRNFPAGWGTFGSSNPSSTSDYRGLSGGSEPETEAMVNCFRKYKPTIHVNTHMWMAPLTAFCGDSAIISSIQTTQANYFNTAKPTYNGDALTPYKITTSGLEGGTVPRQSYDMGIGCTSAIHEINPAGPDQFISTTYGTMPLWAIQQYWYPRNLGLIYGMLDAAKQNPSLGSIDYDATLNGRYISTKITYSISYPSGMVKTFLRMGSVLYNLQAGLYTVKATVNGETLQSTVAVKTGQQARVVLQFGTRSSSSGDQSSFSDGFEGAFPNTYYVRNSFSDTVTRVTSPVKSGAYALAFNIDNVENSGESAFIEKIIPVRSEIYIEGSFRFSSVPTSGSWNIINVRALSSNPGAYAWLEIHKETSGIQLVMNYRDSATKSQKSVVVQGVTMQANIWYNFEMYVGTGQYGSVKCWLGGTQVLSLTDINNSEWTGITIIQMGERWSTPLSGRHTTYLDNMALSQSFIPQVST